MIRKVAGSRLIYAADLPAVDRNLHVLERIAGLVDVIKIPTALLFEGDFSKIRNYAHDKNIPLFFDLKIADVPHTNATIVRSAIRLGASIVSVHGFIGPDGILACLDAAGESVTILIQLELTSAGALAFNEGVTLEMAEMASGLGVTAVQAPGNKVERVRQIRQIMGDQVDIVCCGVGAQGGSFNQVISAGANFAIVGRSIYKSDDPAASVRSILNS